MTIHVMLDIETYGKGSFAAIRTIGAVKFNPNHHAESLDELMSTTERFHVRVDLKSCFAAGLQADADTIEWWEVVKRDNARAAILAMEKVDLYNALTGFAEWYGEDDSVPVWGNGATFDNVIVLNAYGRCNLPRPWSYKADRCFRTLKEMWPEVEPTDVGTAHGALDDALAQAWWMQRIVRHMRVGYRDAL